MCIKTIPSNDNDYEKTSIDLLRSTSKIPIFFNKNLQKATPQIKRSYYHLHTNFEYLLFFGVSYKEVHTKGPHPHPLPNESSFLTTMVIGMLCLWLLFYDQFVRVKEAPKYFTLWITYFYVACLVSSAHATYPQGLAGLWGACQLNRSLSKTPSTAVTTTRWHPQLQ